MSIRFHNIDKSRSYATERGLETAMARMFGDDKAGQAIIVCNRSGRFTAVFPLSACRPDLSLFARHGFLTLG